MSTYYDEIAAAVRNFQPRNAMPPELERHILSLCDSGNTELHRIVKAAWEVHDISRERRGGLGGNLAELRQAIDHLDLMCQWDALELGNVDMGACCPTCGHLERRSAP